MFYTACLLSRSTDKKSHCSFICCRPQICWTQKILLAPAWRARIRSAPQRARPSACPATPGWCPRGRRVTPRSVIGRPLWVPAQTKVAGLYKRSDKNAFTILTCWLSVHLSNVHHSKNTSMTFSWGWNAKKSTAQQTQGLLFTWGSVHGSFGSNIDLGLTWALLSVPIMCSRALANQSRGGGAFLWPIAFSHPCRDT